MFVRGDTPFCPPAGRVKQLPPWNPFDGLPGNLQAAFQRAPLHALLVSRSYIRHDEAMSTFSVDCGGGEGLWPMDRILGSP